MSYSVQILEPKVNGGYDVMLGSEGTIKLDGRYAYERADYEAMDYYTKQKRFRPYIVGYRLLRNGQKVRDFIFRVMTVEQWFRRLAVKEAPDLPKGFSCSHGAIWNAEGKQLYNSDYLI